MEFNKPMDVLSFDWDDSELIKAYDRSMKNKKSSSKSKEYKASKAREEKAVRTWLLGDYCRAIYPEDGLFYEATIISLEGKSCTVEFLGYGDFEVVPLDSLEESQGKKARQKQRKSVKKAELSILCNSDTDFSSMNDSKDVSKIAKSGHLPNGNTTAEAYDYYADGYAQHQPQANLQQHSAPPQVTFNHTMHTPAVPVPVHRVGGAAHCLPPPPPPPMPPCSSVANDPSLSAMLVSWYMAGYYTGLHQNQKSSHCLAVPKTHCCEHHVSNHCGHFF